MGYTTTDNLLEALPDATGTSTAILQRFIDRASAMLDEACADSWPEAGTAADRTFYGSGTHLLRIDYHEDALVTSVTMPDGWTAPAFVEIRDTSAATCYLNTTNSEGRLYNSSTRMPGGYAEDPWIAGYSLAIWPAGLPIVVNAAWGYATTPGYVEDACIAIIQANWRETYAQSEDTWHGTVGRDWRIPPRVRDFIADRSARSQFGVTG